jgi:preprotein translocase subunit SecE
MAVSATPQGQTPGPGRRLVTFYHGVMAELRRVTWPDVPQVRSATLAILVFVLFIGLLIFVLDAVLRGLLVQLIPSLFT